MHAKTLIFDGKIVLTGSVNMTHNGYENNKEHMLRLVAPKAVADFVADFEEEWQQAIPVTQDAINDMLKKYQQRRGPKDGAESDGPVRSGSSGGPTRKVTRSLSSELKEVSDSATSSALEVIREAP